MREIIFFGSDNYVETNRNEIMDHCKSYFIYLGLKFRIVTASDPFFTSGAEAKRIYQSALALKYEYFLKNNKVLRNYIKVKNG